MKISDAKLAEIVRLKAEVFPPLTELCNAIRTEKAGIRDTFGRLWEHTGDYEAVPFSAEDESLWTYVCALQNIEQVLADALDTVENIDHFLAGE